MQPVAIPHYIALTDGQNDLQMSGMLCQDKNNLSDDMN